MGACISRTPHTHELPTGDDVTGGPLRFKYRDLVGSGNLRTRKYKPIVVINKIQLPTGHIVEKNSKYALISQDFVNDTWGLYAMPDNQQDPQQKDRCKCILHYRHGKLSVPSDIFYQRSAGKLTTTPVRTASSKGSPKPRFAVPPVHQTPSPSLPPFVAFTND